LRHGEGALPVDLLCQQQIQTADQRWQLDFSLDLPRSGRIDVTLLVKFPAVALRLCSSRTALCETWRRQQDSLVRAFKDCGLKLEEFVCVDSSAPAMEAVI
jgi:Flagellar hook-length control protein FliK